MLTLLKTDQQPGLQILSGGRFIDVSPKQGTFIVNLGDMLERYGHPPYRLACASQKCIVIESSRRVPMQSAMTMNQQLPNQCFASAIPQS